MTTDELKQFFSEVEIHTNTEYEGNGIYYNVLTDKCIDEMVEIAKGYHKAEKELLWNELVNNWSFTNEHDEACIELDKVQELLNL